MGQITSAAIELARLANGGDHNEIAPGTRLRIMGYEQAQGIIELTKTAMTTDATEELAKSVTISTGLTAYNLRAPSLLFSPTITPVRNSLKRTQLANPGPAANWRSINALTNAPNYMAWVPEGRRAGSITYTATPNSATYASMGVEDDLTDEAKYAAVGYEDEEALVQLRSLYKLMQIEEASLIHGNTSMTLSVPAAATLTAPTTAGATLPSATYYVKVVALTAVGMLQAALATGIVTSTSVASNDGAAAYTLNGGCSNISNESSQAVTLGQALVGTTPPIAGAAGYAWFVSSATGTETLQAITSVAAFSITAPLAGGRQASSAVTGDFSKNSLAYDGLMTQAFTNSGVSYINTLTTGNTLTAVGDGEVVEIRAMLKSMWDQNRVSVSKIYVNSQELASITKLVLSNGSAPLVRMNTTATDGGPSEVRYTAGAVVGWYFNPYSADGGRFIPILIHPDMPAGTIFGYAETLPAWYMSNETPTVAELLLRQDYYVEKWPRLARRQYYGTYCQSVPAVYAPFCLAVINNITPN